MSPGAIALVVVAVSVVVWALFMVNTTIRKQRRAALATGGAVETRERPEPAAAVEAPEKKEQAEVEVQKVPEKERKPLSPDQLAVSRRQFLNRAWTASFMAFLGFFGMGTLSFLWPKLVGAFGARITVGNHADLVATVGPDGEFMPMFIPEGRFWLTYYDGTADSAVYDLVGAQEAQLLALYRKCPHLGCSVPHCSTSMLFECPCHGSKYRLNGEFHSGPAPRGLDRFPVEIVGGQVVVDTGDVQTGPPRGTNTWDRFAEPVGPFCVPI